MTTASQEMRAIRSELNTIAKLLKSSAAHRGNGVAHDTLETLSDTFGFDTNDIKRMANKAGKTVRHFVDDKTKQAAEAQENFEEAVSSHPYKAIATAAASGLLIGVFLGRK